VSTKRSSAVEKPEPGRGAAEAFVVVPSIIDDAGSRPTPILRQAGAEAASSSDHRKQLGDSIAQAPLGGTARHLIPRRHPVNKLMTAKTIPAIREPPTVDSATFYPGSRVFNPSRVGWVVGKSSRYSNPRIAGTWTQLVTSTRATSLSGLRWHNGAIATQMGVGLMLLAFE